MVIAQYVSYEMCKNLGKSQKKHNNHQKCAHFIIWNVEQKFWGTDMHGIDGKRGAENMHFTLLLWDDEDVFCLKLIFPVLFFAILKMMMMTTVTV